MAWFCEKCLCSVLSGGAPCPKCGVHRPGFRPDLWYEVYNEVRDLLLKALKSKEAVDTWLNTKHSVFGDMNAEDFIQELLRIGNIETAEDGWCEVRGAVRRIYG